MSPTSVVLSIVLAIAAFGGIAFWDERREARAALGDFGHEQVTLARGVAAALEVRTAPQLEPIGLDVFMLRAAFASVSEPETMALLEGPGESEFLSSAGGHFRLPTLAPSDEMACWLGAGAASPSIPDSAGRAEEGARCWQTISREEAAALGLPERPAVVGFSGFTDKEGGRWRLAVVATARRERDREQEAVWRRLLGFVLSSGLVLALGTLALKRQRRELALARELAARETDRIGRVMRGLLALGRGGSPSLEKVDPKTLAVAAVDLVLQRFRAAGVTLRFVTDEGLPEVSCDPRLLEQAIVNLLFNACDACAVGGTVDLSVRRLRQNVVLVVTDDGEGIGAQAALHATEPLATKPEGGGAELGLAIANEIVRHHHGKFSIAARVGARGTEARIELPVAGKEI